MFHLFFGLKNKQDEARERYKTRLTLPVIEVCNTSSNDVLRRFSARKKIPSDRQSKGIIYAYKLKARASRFLPFIYPFTVRRTLLLRYY